MTVEENEKLDKEKEKCLVSNDRLFSTQIRKYIPWLPSSSWLNNSFFNSLDAVLGMFGKQLAALMLINIMQFVGNAIFYASLSDRNENNPEDLQKNTAELVSALTSTFESLTVIFVIPISHTLINIGYPIRSLDNTIEKDGDAAGDIAASEIIESNTESNSILHQDLSFLPAITGSSIAIGLSAGILSLLFFPFSENVLKLTIDDDETLAVAERNFWKFYPTTIIFPITFSLSLLSSVVFSMYKTLLSAFFVRLIVLLTVGELLINNSELPFDQRVDRFNITNNIVWTLMGFFFLAALKYQHPEKFTLNHYGRKYNDNELANNRQRDQKLIFLKESLYYAGQAFKYAVAFFTNIVPSLISQFMIFYYARLIGQESIEAARGLMDVGIIVLLCGIAFLSTAQGYASNIISVTNKLKLERPNELQQFVNDVIRSVKQVNSALFKLILVMILLAVASSLAAQKVIENKYAPGNSIINNPIILLLTVLAFGGQTLNDLAEGFLSGFDKKTVKGLITTTAFTLAMGLAYFFGVSLNAGLMAVFGSYITCVSASALLLNKYLNDKLPCLKANIPKLLSGKSSANNSGFFVTLFGRKNCSDDEKIESQTPSMTKTSWV